MSWFSSSSDNSLPSQNFHPVTSSLTGFGELSEKDTSVRLSHISIIFIAELEIQWLCTYNRGFQTETQTFYSILSDGSFFLCQVIWSYTG